MWKRWVCCGATTRRGQGKKMSNDKSRLHTDVHAEAKVKPQNYFFERTQPPPLSLPTASSTRGEELPFVPLSRR